MSRYLLSFFLVTSTLALHAQEEAPDSLVRFRELMQQESIKEFAPPAPEQFVLVWKEQREGHTLTFTRGDGSTLKDLLTPDGQLRPDACDHCWPNGLTNYGNKYVLVWVSPNTGLARFTGWYFERRP